MVAGRECLTACVAALIWIVKRGMLGGLRRRLAAVGQMALTNDLFHSMTASVLFLGWGFGLAGRFDYAAQLLVVSSASLSA